MHSNSMDAIVWIRRLPWSIVGLAIVLVGFGLAGIHRSEVLSHVNSSALLRQSIWAMLAFVAMLATSLFNYRRLWRHGYAIFCVTIVLLVAVYFFPPIHGARRWIRIGEIGLQPSEFAKVAFVIAMARYLMFRDNFRKFRGLALPLALTLIPVVLILREPDLGTALVFLPVLFAMLYSAGARLRDLSFVLAAAAVVSPILWSQMSREQKSRVTALFRQSGPSQTPDGDQYHLHQVKQMCALGGFWGSYIRDDELPDRTVYALPEGSTDSILAVLSERFGQMGVGLVLASFATLIWRIIKIAQATREPFGRLLAAGVASLFAVEVIINSGMMVGLLPITGLSLPLVSYGGSGLVAHSLALGLVLNVGLRPGYEVSPEPFRYAT